MQRISLLLSFLLVCATALSAQSRASYSIILRTDPAKPRTGEEVALHLTAIDRRGSTISSFNKVHERPLHLIVVSRDLSEFSHLHPEYDGKGAFRVSYRFPVGGEYRLFADLQPAGLEAAVLPLSLMVAGTLPPAKPLGADRMDFVSSEDGIRVVLNLSDRPTSGKALRMTFAVTDVKTGAVVDDLEPYLGSLVHVIIVRAETLDFLHVHQVESTGAEAGGGRHGHHRPSVASGTTLTAETRFPSAGRYRIWAQLQRGGQVITASFDLTVVSNQ